MRCASVLRCPWLVMGSVPPVDSMTISAQKTPVEICTEATLEMGMLSSLEPNSRDFQQPKQSEGFEFHRPRKQKDCFHVEHHKQDSNDVIAHSVSSARAVDRVDAALVRHQLRFARVLRTHQLGGQQRDRQQRADNGNKDEDRNVILRHTIRLAKLRQHVILSPLPGYFKQRPRSDSL